MSSRQTSLDELKKLYAQESAEFALLKGMWADNKLLQFIMKFGSVRDTVDAVLILKCVRDSIVVVINFTFIGSIAFFYQFTR